MSAFFFPVQGTSSHTHGWETLGMLLTFWAKSLQVGAATAAALLLFASSAASAAYVEGGGDDPKDYFISNADGAFVSMATVSPLDVTFSNGGRGTTLPNGAIESSHNSRSLVIESFATGDQIAMGYAAGVWDTTVGRQYSGLNPTRGIHKRAFFYVDGCSNQPTSCRVYFQYRDVVAAPEVHTYQMQRNILPEGARWRFWLDGRQIPGAYTSTITADLLNVVSSHSGNQSLNLTQKFERINYHRYGSSSSAPPGLTNYRSVPWLGGYTTSNCVTANGVGRFEVYGTC